MKRIQTNDRPNTSTIVGIQFSILSKDEIKNNAVVEIVSKEMYTNATNGLAVGGLFDAKMGVLKPGLYCPTDGQAYLDCPGYFGAIVMAMPVFFPSFIKDIVKVSKCVCCECGKLLVNKRKFQYVRTRSAEDRWEWIHNPKTKKSKRCGDSSTEGCGAIQPSSVKLDGFAKIVATWKFKGSPPRTETLTAERLYNLFSRISDDDVNFIGMSSTWSRPENMICNVLPVAPPAVRPSVEQDSQQRSEDDMTTILMQIVKNNQILKDKIRDNAPANVIDKHHQIVQYFVAMIADNKISGTSPIAQPSGRTLQCISDRLNSKAGRIRANLMGKRVDFSARTVITGDPNVPISFLGVPKKMAMNITKPEKVTSRNLNYLTSLVQNGPEVYPGAKSIVRANGDTISLSSIDRMAVQLRVGDTVNRHLRNGEYVIFNRQPSLHKMSMQGHEVIIMENGDTFRFNVAVTAPYNADFDGDEMNMHVPQSIRAENELRLIAAVKYQLISPSKNSMIVGLFQDSCLGLSEFTRPGISFTVPRAMQLLALYPHLDPTVFKGKKRVTSYEILSQILPPITLTFHYKNGVDPVIIRNGVWVSGQAYKAATAASSKGLLHRLCNDFGRDACVDFINNVQNIVTEYMKTNSFSVGVSDLITSGDTHQKIKHSVAEANRRVAELTNQVQLGLFENDSAYSNSVEYERQVSNILAEARGAIEKIGSDGLRKDNRFLTIVKCGSKGSMINISQMSSCLGQQTIAGTRAPYGYDNRSLPHFNKYDDSQAARGFVESSYVVGLSPHEMFFHAMAGRIGLIDTAVKTSQTGYAQRRLVKAMEDVMIVYGGTARNHMGKVVQFVYGDDGFDSTKVETQSFPLVRMSVEDIYMKYDMVSVNVADSKTRLLAHFTQAAKVRIGNQIQETKMKCQEYIDRMIGWRDDVVSRVFNHRDDDSVRVPVSFEHIIANIKGQLDTTNHVVDITPLEAFEMVEACYQNIRDWSPCVPNNELFLALFHFYLCPKDLLFVHRFGRTAMTLLLETVFLRTKQAFVHPGEMVGVIAAQSVGEPTTQLTLNTFHNTGVASKANVTRGVPRIDEILRLTDNPKNSSLTVTPFPHDEQSQDKAASYSNLIECTLLRDVVLKAQIFYDPSNADTVVAEDVHLLNQYRAFQEKFSQQNSIDPDLLSKWIVRLELDARAMHDKNITMDDIHFAITALYGAPGVIDESEEAEAVETEGGSANAKKTVNGAVQCIYSDFNDSKLVFRIRVGAFVPKKGSKKSLDMSDEIGYIKAAQSNMLNKVVLRGVSGITKVIPRKLRNMTVLQDGKHVQKDVWVLDTTGTNMLDVLGLPYIDYRRTVSNDIREVQSVLGIEAARQVVYNELVEVMEFSDVYINHHHISLLADRMSYSKNMVAVFRNGLNNDNTGPIAKATFEMHTEMFLRAAKHGELDNMRGVSANVMCGQHGHYGTSAFQVHLDMDAYEKLTALRSDQEQAPKRATMSAFDVDEAVDVMFGEVINSSKPGCDPIDVVIPNYLSSTQTTDQGGIHCMNDGYDMGF